MSKDQETNTVAKEMLTKDRLKQLDAMNRKKKPDRKASPPQKDRVELKKQEKDPRDRPMVEARRRGLDAERPPDGEIHAKPSVVCASRFPLPEAFPTSEFEKMFNEFGPVATFTRMGTTARVVFEDKDSALEAVRILNNQLVQGTKVSVVFSNTDSSVDQNARPAAGQFHLFIGDLSPNVDDDYLARLFGPYGNLSEARVMWDRFSGLQRGYGFVAFTNYASAKRAISELDGHVVEGRPIRCAWANTKPKNWQGVTIQDVLSWSESTNCTVYVGNLGPGVTEEDLTKEFSKIGEISSVRLMKARQFAFVTFASRLDAATAILQCHGHYIRSRPLRCSWSKDTYGRDRSSSDSTVSDGFDGDSMVQWGFIPTPPQYCQLQMPEYGQLPVMPPYQVVYGYIPQPHPAQYYGYGGNLSVREHQSLDRRRLSVISEDLPMQSHWGFGSVGGVAPVQLADPVPFLPRRPEQFPIVVPDFAPPPHTFSHHLVYGSGGYAPTSPSFTPMSPGYASESPGAYVLDTSSYVPDTSHEFSNDEISVDRSLEHLNISQG